MTKQPVTIGGQTFIYDTGKGGWIDKKTKGAADKSLIKLLDTVSQELPNSFENLKTKLDKTVEPVKIGEDKFVFDANKGWMNAKTKFVVPSHMQKMLNEAVGQRPVEAIKDTAPKIVQQTGIIGELVWKGAQWVDPKTGRYVSRKDAEDRGFKTPGQAKKPVAAKETKGAAARPPVANDNPTPVKQDPLVSLKGHVVGMIGHLFVIDDLLKQKLRIDQEETRYQAVVARERMVKAFPIPRIVSKVKDSLSKSSPMAILGIVGALAAFFEPVRTAIGMTWSALKFVAKGLWTTFKGVNWALGKLLTALGGDPVTTKAEDLKNLPTFDKFAEEATPKIKKVEPGYEPKVSSALEKGEKYGKETSYFGGLFKLKEVEKDSTEQTPAPKKVEAPTSTGSGQSVSKAEAATKVEGPQVSGSLTNPLDKMERTGGRTWWGAHRGKRRDGSDRYHWGTDFRAQTPTPVKSIQDGVVSRVATQIGKDGTGWGKYIVVDHGGGIDSLYAHLSKQSVKEGDKIRAGQVIGVTGESGAPGQPHLHIEIRKNGNARLIDPEKYLAEAIKSSGNNKKLSATYPVDTKPETAHNHDHSKHVTPHREETHKHTEDSSDKSLIDKANDNFKWIVEKMISGVKRVSSFDKNTDYKPFVQTTNGKSGAIDTAAIETHKTEAEAKLPKIIRPHVAMDRPNLNKNGGTVRTPVSSSESDVIKQYLKYFDLV